MMGRIEKLLVLMCEMQCEVVRIHIYVQGQLKMIEVNKRRAMYLFNLTGFGGKNELLVSPTFG